jgi:ATP-dependent RNA helicase DDX46/PRP5
MKRKGSPPKSPERKRFKENLKNSDYRDRNYEKNYREQDRGKKDYREYPRENERRYYKEDDSFKRDSRDKRDKYERDNYEREKYERDNYEREHYKDPRRDDYYEKEERREKEIRERQRKEEEEKLKLEEEEKIKQERWKKSQELLEKLKKDKELLQLQKEKLSLNVTPQVKQEVVKNEEISLTNNDDLNRIINSNRSKIKIEEISFLNDTTETSTNKTEVKEEEEEEEDPLDQFMKENTEIINNENLKIEVFQNSTQITSDELNQEEIKNESEENKTTEDEELFHKKFLETLKRKEEEEVILSDNIEKGGMLVDDNSMFYEEDEDDVKKTTVSKKKDLEPVDHSKINYPKFRKNFYIESKDVKNLKPSDILKMRLELEIKVIGKDIPPPIHSFHQTGLNDIILNTIQKLGFKKPFAIQSQAIPAIMKGKDIIGCAKTGSGKTMAFVLPMLRHVLDQPPLKTTDGPIALVLVPNRELAIQIYSDIKKFTVPLKLKVCCVFGGITIANQIANLKRKAHIVVGTPGRLIDLLCSNKGKIINLLRTTFLVIDECDRSFDMGFAPQITKIINNIRPDKQIVMFSATFPKPLEALAKQVMKDPCEILVGGRSVASQTIKQYVEIRTEQSKFLRLLELIGKYYEKGQILIFVDRQSEADILYKDLTSASYSCLSLHGGMEQVERGYTIQQFKTSEKNIMVATSICSRGLDIKELNMVINYNCPNHFEEYIHRVGRTGRAGRKGIAYTFIEPTEDKYSPFLVKALKQSKNEVTKELNDLALEYIEKRKKGLVKGTSSNFGFGGKGYKFDKKESDLRKDEEIKQMKELGIIEEKEKTEKEIEEEKQKMEQKDSETILKALSNVLQSKVKETMISMDSQIYSDEISLSDFPKFVVKNIISDEFLLELKDFTAVKVSVQNKENKLSLLLEGTSKVTIEESKNFILKEIKKQTSIDDEKIDEIDFDLIE